jgi:hypothetical protein
MPFNLPLISAGCVQFAGLSAQLIKALLQRKSRKIENVKREYTHNHHEIAFLPKVWLSEVSGL